MVAALYVETNGVYAGLPDVDLWDEARDARLYAGPWPVVAHPPCNHWGQLGRINAARYETFRIGDDRGCFAAALNAVRTWGGVLEHPAHTIAWKVFGLEDGWVTELSQVAYGHPARIRTWLYYVGNEHPAPLDWREPQHTHVVGAGIHTGESTWAPRDERSLRTPLAFRDALLSLARLAQLPDLSPISTTSPVGRPE